MYLSFGSGLHGQGTSSCPASSGMPTEWRHGTNSPSPSAFEHRSPMRVMIFMLTTTYGESEIWTPICAIGEPIGPMLKGMTYIVRPFMQPSNFGVSSAFILSGVHPVVGRTGVFFFLRADVGAVFDASDVARMAAREKRIRPQLRIQLDERAAGDHLVAEPVVFLLRTVAPIDLVRLAKRRHLLDPLEELLVCDGFGGFERFRGHGDLLRSEMRVRAAQPGRASHSASAEPRSKGANNWRFPRQRISRAP